MQAPEVSASREAVNCLEIFTLMVVTVRHLQR